MSRMPLSLRMTCEFWEIRRVAMVTNDRLVSAMPRIALRFVDAEVRAFPMSGRDEALLWVGAS